MLVTNYYYHILRNIRGIHKSLKKFGRLIAQVTLQLGDLRLHLWLQQPIKINNLKQLQCNMIEIIAFWGFSDVIISIIRK